MTAATERQVFSRFERALQDYRDASPLTREQKSIQLVSQIDLLSRSPKGLTHLLGHSLELEELGLFTGTPWADPVRQVPSLVKGTLMAGHPHSSMEIVSELRMLAHSQGKGSVSPQLAMEFIEEVIVNNLEFAFDELTEESRAKLTQQERRKLVGFFKFLLDNARLDGIKSKLLEEIEMVCAQRPVVTNAVRSLIQTVFQKIELDDTQQVDQVLQYYINAIYFPGTLVESYPSYRKYKAEIKRASEKTLMQEASEMGNYLQEVGLTNPYLAMMLQHCLKELPEAIPELLHLSKAGKTEWERTRGYVSELALFVFNENNYRGIYGLKRMLERNLFSRRPVRAGITNLKLINMHGQVERRILKSVASPHANVSAMQYLLGALISLLGQPIGIGQGNNATCQSARGISMWAQHSPAKLINMVTTVATANNLIMRFEERDLESMKLSLGLVERLDFNLDAVSAVLVPNLDKIYNEMMRLSAGRGEDPHRWTNPALYGHWVPTGFASAYDYKTNSVRDFRGFVRLFYRVFHPDFNGGRQMVYPNPVGLFITSSKGVLLGFHAVSLLRVAPNRESEAGEVRAYFLNPNNEGRQDWGQGIKPTVFGNGERHGESSLPVRQFVARIYAFHFNHLNAQTQSSEVPEDEIDAVYDLASKSWGPSYVWNEAKKKW